VGDQKKQCRDIMRIWRAV